MSQFNTLRFTYRIFFALMELLFKELFDFKRAGRSVLHRLINMFGVIDFINNNKAIRFKTHHLYRSVFA